MKGHGINTGIFTDLNAIDEIITADTALVMVFYGAEVDDFALFHHLKKKGIPFLGCMDVSRLVDDYYSMDPKKIAAMTFSKIVIEKVQILSYDMRRNADYATISASSKVQYLQALRHVGIDPENPDIERDFAINLLFGLQSANPVLNGQQSESMYMQTVGGSSGGLLDFKYTSVISSRGMGAIGATAIIRLRPEYHFQTDLVTSFEKMDGTLKVTGLAGPRHITSLNGKPAAAEYARVVGLTENALTPSTFATYTLGIEPSADELLITSIQQGDGKGGLLTYNDLMEDLEFNIFKAKKQTDDRQSRISRLDKSKVVGYVSFDCVLCYLARNQAHEINDVAQMYAKALPDIPKIGFGTFSENLCGANVNQTETYLAILKR